MGMAQCTGTDGTFANRRCGLTPSHLGECRPRRTMYLDPANGMIPHAGQHDENEFCEGAEPKCVVFDRHRADQGGGSSALVGKDRDRPHNVADWRIPPGHYTSKGGIQPWDVVDQFDLDFYSGNALKYILRAGKKDIAPRLDDLKKAANYIAKAIDVEENRE